MNIKKAQKQMIDQNTRPTKERAFIILGTPCIEVPSANSRNTRCTSDAAELPPLRLPLNCIDRDVEPLCDDVISRDERGSLAGSLQAPLELE